MHWAKWLNGDPPIWREEQLDEWLALNPTQSGYIATAARRHIRSADASRVKLLEEFERRQEISAAKTGRLYYTVGEKTAIDAEWCAAALALCWRYTFAPRFCFSVEAVEQYAERRPIVIAGGMDDWRTVLTEAPLLWLRDWTLAKGGALYDAAYGLLTKRLSGGGTTIVNFHDTATFDTFGAHWAHYGNELTAVELSAKRIKS